MGPLPSLEIVPNVKTYVIEIVGLKVISMQVCKYVAHKVHIRWYVIIDETVVIGFRITNTTSESGTNRGLAPCNLD